MSSPSLSRIPPQPPPDRAWCMRLFLTVFVVALLVRAGLGVFSFVRSGDPNRLEFPDEEQYWLMACSLHGGDGLTDELGFRATRMPLYPGLLSLFAGNPNCAAAAKVMQWFAGAAGGVLAAGLALAVFGKRPALVAGLLVAFDPFLAFFSSLLLTETLSIAAVCGLWWLAWRSIGPGGETGSVWCFVALGCVAAVCVYLRESNLVLVAFLLVFLLCAGRFKGRIVVGVVVCAAVVVLALFPWASRNRSVTGDWCWLTHRGGISLYDGVGPQATGASNLGDIKSMPAVAGLDEVEWNRYFMTESLRSMREDPGRILVLAVRKLARTWNPIPNVETYRSGMVRLVSAFWMVPVFAFAVAGIVVSSRREEGSGVVGVVFILLPVLHVVVMHSLFVGSVRYRLAAHPMIEILAAVALMAVVSRIRSGRRMGA